MEGTPQIHKLADFIDQYEYLIFDCDGVVWHDVHPIAGAFKNIMELENRGKKVFFVTNLSRISRLGMARKMVSDAFGYESAKKDTLYPVSTLAAMYVKENMPECKKVLILGDKDLADEFVAKGIEYIGGDREDP